MQSVCVAKMRDSIILCESQQEACETEEVTAPSRKLNTIFSLGDWDRVERILDAIFRLTENRCMHKWRIILLQTLQMWSIQHCLQSHLKNEYV